MLLGRLPAVTEAALAQRAPTAARQLYRLVTSSSTPIQGSEPPKGAHDSKGTPTEKKHTTALKDEHGWHEGLATDAEASVRADRHDMHDVEEMQEHTIKVVTENDEHGSTISESATPDKS